jgi:4-amino-4-deoxy-L-arabinose transferase-like glycosyltransferase
VSDQALSLPAPVGLPGSARERLRTLLRGRPADPAWSRPALLGVALLAGLLMLWGLTVNGYANTYYSSAVYAASHSWSAFFYNALDLSRYVSMDKTPLSIWMMALSARVFGFSSFTMLLPDALCGVACVVVLHDAVRRTLGPRAAILAALMLALTPVTVLMSRFNNPDALLVLLLVCSAWATVRAIETGRTRHLLLAGLLVGLAFNTKMLQAYLVLPALALAYLYAGPGRVRRRVAQLLGAGALTFVVSAAWVGAMMLIPASERPYVGDTLHNSWWELIFEANGLNRVGSGGAAGAGGPVGFGGAQGVLRLFDAEVGAQIAWLLPLAVLGLVVGLWVHRRAPRTDPARAAYMLWGTWALVSFAVFSFALNLFHPYYTSALAPAVAVLAAGGLLALWDRARASRLSAATLAVALVATALLSTSLLDRTPSFVPWLRWLVPAVAFACAAAILVWHTRARTLVLALALAAVLAGPAAYSLATVGRSVTGGNPKAGPAAVESGRGGAPGGGGAVTGGLPGGGGLRLFGGARGGVSSGPPAGLGLPGAAAAGGGGAAGAVGPGGTGVANKRLIVYLEAHRDGAKYLVAADGSMTAAPIILATHQLVVTIGGFSGQDPAPTVTQLERLVSSGQLHYVYGFGGSRGGSAALRRGRFSPGARFGLGGALPGSGASSGGAGAIPGGGAPGGTPPAGGPPGGGIPGGAPGGGGGTSGGGLPGAPGGLGSSSSGARSLQTWVSTHCKTVNGYSGLEQCSAS